MKKISCPESYFKSLISKGVKEMKKKPTPQKVVADRIEVITVKDGAIVKEALVTPKTVKPKKGKTGTKTIKVKVGDVIESKRIRTIDGVVVQEIPLVEPKKYKNRVVQLSQQIMLNAIKEELEMETRTFTAEEAIILILTQLYNELEPKAGHNERYMISSNFDIVLGAETYNGEFGYDEDGSMNTDGFAVDTLDWLMKELEKKRDSRHITYRSSYGRSVAKKMVEDLGKNHKHLAFDSESLSSELAELIGDQFDCESDAENNDDLHMNEYATIHVERFVRGEWTPAYSIVNGKKQYVQFEYHNSEIFKLNEDGDICGLHYVELASGTRFSSVRILMAQEDLFLEAVLTNKNGQDYVVPQRFMVSSSGLRHGLEFDGDIINGTPASSWNIVAKDSKGVNRIVYAPTHHYRDAEYQMDMGDGVILSPSTQDITRADIDNKKYDKGITCGTSEATTSMMMNDILDYEADLREEEEENERFYRERSEYRSNAKKNIKAESKIIAIESLDEIGEAKIATLIEKAHAAKSYGEKIRLQSWFAAQPDAYRLLIKKNIGNYKKKHGKQLPNEFFHFVMGSNTEVVKVRKADLIDEAILEKCNQINAGTLSIDDLKDNEAVLVLAAARASKLARITFEDQYPRLVKRVSDLGNSSLRA